jgi:MEMO1 family protein
MWYPQKKQDLEQVLEQYLSKKMDIKQKEIHGVIVPHAGYIFSGEIAGKSFSLLKQKFDKAIIIGPSHYAYLTEAVVSDKEKWETPLGEIKILRSDFKKLNINEEHSIKNQVPFLQKLGIKEILPLVMGEITVEQAKKIAKKISKIENAVYVFSTDLSHFLPYEKASLKDKQTIKIIENLDIDNKDKIDACGLYPILVMIELCKIKKWTPELVEYKNSGDITGDKSSVVGYASFVF